MWLACIRPWFGLLGPLRGCGVSEITITPAFVSVAHLALESIVEVYCSQTAVEVEGPWFPPWGLRGLGTWVEESALSSFLSRHSRRGFSLNFVALCSSAVSSSFLFL